MRRNDYRSLIGVNAAKLFVYSDRTERTIIHRLDRGKADPRDCVELDGLQPLPSNPEIVLIDHGSPLSFFGFVHFTNSYPHPD